MKSWALGISALIAVILLFIRLTGFAPLGYSISTYDTNAFIAAGRIPLTSIEFFTADRPATINLVYKSLEPGSGYQITSLSSPAENIYESPAVQPGLQNIAIAQRLLSVSAWLLLAVVVARQLKNNGIKILAFSFILAFGFSPPVAEWDSVLLSEPISLALFVILLAASIEVVSHLVKKPRVASSNETNVLIGFWGIALVFWVFARDTNSYLLLALLAMLGILFILRWRNVIIAPFSTRSFVSALASLTLLFFFHNATFQPSGRWIVPFFNNVLHNVLPYPDRVAFFEAKGMPISDEVWALRNSPGNEAGFFGIPDLMTWTREHGTSAYIQFLLTYPGWTVDTFLTGVEKAFSENRQPFYFPSENSISPALGYVGDLLHPKDASVILVVMAELAVLGAIAFRQGRAQGLSLFVLFFTFFLGEILMLFVSIHGDLAIGVVRHSMGSVMPLRLSIWLLPLFILDLYAMPGSS